MKVKYFVIVVLVAFLGWIIYLMMKYETRIRSERIVKVKIKDENRPLLIELPEEKLIEYSMNSDYYFMADGDYFRVLNTKTKKRNWEKIFLKGVNLGVAMPGNFPTEFTLTFNDYLDWFLKIGEMNANVIRTYTILPPEFYEALSYYNLHYYNRKLYLLHGVWTEEPLQENYYHPKSQREFQQEIIDVIDIIHGKAVIDKKPGHAHGTYANDISKYVIGIILGREWEPKAVTKTNRMHTVNRFSGNFINVNNASPMEVWLAQMMDFTVLYETQTYKTQHPVSFVNWLTLDPMYHSTEFIENEKIKEYDNDLEEIDMRKFNTTELFFPGIFASYHAYPYYPDFIYLQDNYRNAVNRYGQKDNFMGYLKELKKYHTGMPLVIAEYGLPSSRGNSHYNPFGYHQGGLSEKEQSERSVVLTEDIFDSKCAGAIFFEWIDEWFKFNWLVMDFEQPQERRVFWHNMENPENNFGILAVESRSKTIDGILSDWKDLPSTNNNDAFISFDADASYFYISAYLPDFSFEKNNLYLAIDTYDKTKGDHKLPFLDREIDPGIEFLLEFISKDKARILVDDQYTIYTDIYSGISPLYTSKKNNNGIFVEQLLLPNRGRETLLGDTIKPVFHNRSRLVHGKSNRPADSNCDWYWNDSSKTLEVRLTWHSINVSDPSQRYVLDDIEGTQVIECSQTSGFTVLNYITDKNNKLQKQGKDTYSWKTWEQPEYKSRLKPIYYSLRYCFSRLDLIINKEKIALPVNENFLITQFYENKPGAISITFDGAHHSQYQNALPPLEMYKIKASFGIMNEWINTIATDQGNYMVKRMGLTEISKLVSKNHEVVLQVPDNIQDIIRTPRLTSYLISLRLSLEKISNKKVLTVNYPYTMSDIPSQQLLMTRENFLFTLKGGNSVNALNNLKYNNLYYIPVGLRAKPSRKQLDSIFSASQGMWSILGYQYILPEDSKELNMLRSAMNKDIYAISPQLFERHVRLIRNSGYWIAPVSSIGKYLKERDAAVINTIRHNNLIFLNVSCALDKNIFNHPLTIEFTTGAKKIRVLNSAADGVYNVREGKVYFNVYPNKEVTIEIIEK